MGFALWDLGVWVQGALYGSKEWKVKWKVLHVLIYLGRGSAVFWQVEQGIVGSP